MSRHCDRVNGPQNECSVGKSNADASIDRAISASSEPADQRPASGGAHRRRRRRAGPRAGPRAVAIAAQEPDDRGVLAGPRAHRRGEPVLVERPPRRSSGGIAPRRRRRGATGRGDRGGLLARGDGLASGHAGLVGRLGRDPGGIRLDREPLELRGRARPRRAGGARRGRMASRVSLVDPVDLGRASRAPLPRRRRASCRRERATRNACWAASLAARTARGSAAAASASARLTWSS